MNNTEKQQLENRRAIIEWVEISGDSLKRVKKNRLEFKPGINILIGPNGSGKSTFMEAIKLRSKGKDGHLAEDTVMHSHQGLFYHIDFEKDNLRTLSYFRDEVIAQQIAFRYKSHGECTKFETDGWENESFKGALIMADEPEQALDVIGIQNLAKTIKKSLAAQIIIATHAPYLILHPNFNIVETVDGYLEKVKKHIHNIVGFFPNKKM